MTFPHGNTTALTLTFDVDALGRVMSARRFLLSTRHASALLSIVVHRRAEWSLLVVAIIVASGEKRHDST